MPTKLYTFLLTLLLLTPFAFGETGKSLTNGTFIRKTGTYSLDDKGSDITIQQSPNGEWSLKMTWKNGQGITISDSPDIQHQSGWFIYVENSHRIWIYDGVKHLLFSGLDGNNHKSGMSSEIYATCPQVVRDAVKASESKKP